MGRSRKLPTSLSNGEIQELLKKGRVIETPWYRLIFEKVSEQNRQIAILVSRRIGIAVVRNRIRRRFREIIRANKKDIPSSRIVIIPKKRVIEEEFSILSQSFQESIRNNLK